MASDTRSLPEWFHEARDQARHLDEAHYDCDDALERLLAALDAIAERQHEIDLGVIAPTIFCGCREGFDCDDCLALRAACKGKP